jgi:hypothetical protein
MSTQDDPALRPTGGLMLDERAVDHLLDGLLGPQEVPAEYVAVVGLLRALSLPPSPAELSMQTVAVEATLTELALRPAPRGSKAPIPASVRRWSERSRFFRAKVASLVLVGTLIGTTGLAAAGTLPAPLQDVASKVLAKVGISVPTSDGHPARSGEEISKTATTTDATGVDKGAQISTAASGGHSQAGQNGKPSPPTHPAPPAPPAHPGQPASSGVHGKSDDPHAVQDPTGNAHTSGAANDPSASAQEHGKSRAPA